ncbi:MAG TPA: AAA family ATPase [Geminocystis sp. M7585_C2015_104]|nr:AAA family ATPase [Geminocystis sp. M7585_C2015_104]
MIPLRLKLKNFLSYKEAELNFEGLHTACICGANGAGKSSLLEAITWAIWGKTRASSDDDLVHLGETETRVDFEFFYNQKQYRIIRIRNKSKSSALDFQLFNGQEYKSIAGSGIRETQDKISQCLKIDYDTFINSAYIRQGRADEFMLLTPAQRKEVLADLLKLESYEKLAEDAKNLAREFKVRAEEIKKKIEENQERISQKPSLFWELEHLERELNSRQKLQGEIKANLENLRRLNDQRLELLKRKEWQEGQLARLFARLEYLENEKKKLAEELEKLQQILAREAEIVSAYRHWQLLTEKNDELNQKLHRYQQLRESIQYLESQLNKEKERLKISLEREKANLDNLSLREEELRQTISKYPNLDKELEKLRACRQQLAILESIQEEAHNLLQKKYALEKEVEREKALLIARLENLQKEYNNIQKELQEILPLRRRFFQLEQDLTNCRNIRNYQKRVQEKGDEKKIIISQLLNRQTDLETQLTKLTEKLNTLQEKHAICPLCERELDESHLQYVVAKTRMEYKQLELELWNCKAQIVEAERELENLRKEYGELNQKLAQEEHWRKEYAFLENRLDYGEELSTRLEELQEEINAIMSRLENGDYASLQRQKILEIEQKIRELNYSEENHAILRKEEAALRWAETQETRLKEAQNELEKIGQQKEYISQKIRDITEELSTIARDSEIQRKLQHIQQELAEINYDSREHQQVVETLRELQQYQQLYADLFQAQKNKPHLENQIIQITENSKEYQEEKNKIIAELEETKQQLSSLKDYGEQLTQLEEEAKSCQEKIQELLMKKGRLEQSLAMIQTQEEEVKQLEKQLKETQKQHRIHEELGIAFGKNGIQSLMIENILPLIENEANRILNNLTGNQLSVKFVTQKQTKSGRGKNSNPRDTLDIIIADNQGTRAYETYSGGEAFRVNFAIRLALSRILAQRAGTPLQMLIIDEGFGSQDAEGCERLIAAINAVAPEFACILTVTHISQFKEAFQTKIEVYKTPEGSKIRLVG